jgi:hypothetical protein
VSSIGSELLVVYYRIQETINKRSLSVNMIAVYISRENTGAVLSGGMRVLTARAIFVDLKRLAFQMETVAIETCLSKATA